MRLRVYYDLSFEKEGSDVGRNRFVIERSRRVLPRRWFNLVSTFINDCNFFRRLHHFRPSHRNRRIQRREQRNRNLPPFFNTSLCRICNPDRRRRVHPQPVAVAPPQQLPTTRRTRRSRGRTVGLFHHITGDWDGENRDGVWCAVNTLT